MAVAGGRTSHPSFKTAMHINDAWIFALKICMFDAVLRGSAVAQQARVSTSLSLLTKQAQTGMHMFGAHTQETLRTVLSEEMYARLVKLGLGSTSLALVGAAAVMVTILLIRIVVVRA